MHWAGSSDQNKDKYLESTSRLRRQLVVRRSNKAAERNLDQDGQTNQNREGKKRTEAGNIKITEDYLLWLLSNNHLQISSLTDDQ